MKKVKHLIYCLRVFNVILRLVHFGWPEFVKGSGLSHDQPHHFYTKLVEPYRTFWKIEVILGAVAKLWKATVSLSCLSVSLSTRNNSAPTTRIFTKLYI